MTNTATIPSIDKVAACYLAGKETAPSLEDQDYFAGWLEAEFAKVASMVRFTPREVDPAQLLIRYANTGQLLISSANNQPAAWMTKQQNARFRAVHDWHHLQAAEPRFDWQGEVEALREACKTAPNQIQWILCSEVALQAAVAISTGFFPSQKTVMPPLNLLGRLCGWSGF